MTDEKKVVDDEGDVLSDDELESIAGGQGGAAGKQPETQRPMERAEDPA